jgi:dihydroorotase
MMSGDIPCVLLRGGRVVDPVSKRDGVFDVLMKDGVIAQVAPSIPAPDGAVIVDASGKIVAPGLVDLCVHLREPGDEGAEDIESGTRAAAAGGVTSVVAMPDTRPLIDEESDVQFLLRRAAETASVRVWPTGALTMGASPERLAEIGAMTKAGAVAVCDAGQSIPTTLLFRRALEYAKAFDVPVMLMPDDDSLAPDGVMNESSLATRLGHRGIPRQAETIGVARAVALADLTGTRVILGPITTSESVSLLREAKRRGIPVGGWTAPHYFTLTEQAVVDHGAVAKVLPPLRGDADREALIQGLVDGVIDAVASDHGPRSRSSKDQEFAVAPFGMIGLETLLPLVVTHLIAPGRLLWSQAIERLSSGPARLLGLPVGSLAVGASADAVVIDPTAERVIASFRSRSRNSPFFGVPLKGFPVAVFVGGRPVS